jgi:Mrp family chromosome partitioning ATPase
MMELLARLRSSFDYVVIDTPPLLAVSDGAVVSAIADGAIMVAQVGTTRREELAQSTKALRDVGAKVIGIVLNRTAPVKHVYYGPRDQAELRRSARLTRESPIEPAEVGTTAFGRHATRKADARHSGPASY